VDFKTGEIFLNDSRAVTALQFMADLVVKHKVTPPEVTTWEYDEIIAGGQRDRYMMAQTFAPYGTLIWDSRPPSRRWTPSPRTGSVACGAQCGGHRGPSRPASEVARPRCRHSPSAPKKSSERARSTASRSWAAWPR
jgi:hypothetical protein